MSPIRNPRNRQNSVVLERSDVTWHPALALLHFQTFCCLVLLLNSVNTLQMTAMTEASTSTIKRYRPYFHPVEVERLSAKQRGKLSVSREERARQQACALLDAVGVRCGL